jgi:hypothetical protein
MTLILLAIIESSVWLSLTLAEALRLPTGDQISSRTFHIEAVPSQKPFRLKTLSRSGAKTSPSIPPYTPSHCPHKAS